MTPPARRPAARASPSAAPELAEVVRRHAHRLGEGLSGEQRRILRAIAACRTADLGGHVEACDHCPYRRVAYNSCRNRHCPKCQASACARWAAGRAEELLPVEYSHVVFTLPDDFNALALANRRVVYGVLFDAAARTLLEVAADPKHLGARVGFLSILHTWGQNLSLHPHVHCVVPGGGLSPDGARWVACRPGFFLPVRVLSRVFRGKFIEGLKRARRQGKLVGADDGRAFGRLLDAAVRRDWVVYAKPPFGSPARVLKYLARYTHRIAIANRRLLAVDDRTVTFAYSDYAARLSSPKSRGGNRRRTMTLDGGEFLRRFLLHAVPPGFMRVRHYGLLANRGRGERLALCRRLLAVGPATTAAVEPVEPAQPIEPVAAAGRPCCPACGRGRLVPGPHLSPPELHRLLATTRLDSS